MDLKVWELFLSPPLIAALCAMFSAQIFKIFLPLLAGKGLDPKQFVSYGNIPSAHTAFIVAVTVSIGFQEGWKSSLFALAAVVAIIIVYDILKMRKTVEMNMNLTLQLMEKNSMPLEKKMPQFKGHSFLEIAAGVVWGSVWSFIISMIVL